MKLCVAIPSFALHGGIRVVIELAKALLIDDTEVTLYSLNGLKGIEYWNIDNAIKIVDKFNPNLYDTLLITSPHSIHLSRVFKGKIFMHLQMMEHMFNPQSKDWQNKCLSMYKAPYPLFCISKWVMRDLKDKFQRRNETIYMGNGVNLEHFPIKNNPKNGKSILIEGWEAYNPTKDKDRVGPQVAAKLKEDGYKIMVFGQVPLQTYNEIPDEYYCCPKLDKINELYEEATILIKASRVDCRSCSPVEAMTKGTVTVRAIVEGDDDLIDDYNALRVPYTVDELYKASKKILEDENLRLRLAMNGFQHIKNNTWDKWGKFVYERITS